MLKSNAYSENYITYNYITYNIYNIYDIQHEKKNGDTYITKLYWYNLKGNQNETIDTIVSVNVNIIENKTPITQECV